MFRWILFPFEYVSTFFRLVNYNFKAFREWMFILLITFVFLFFALIQLDIIGFPQQLYISTENISEFFLGLFQVQATVSTLGIALISIISGVLNTKYYGIQVTDYILNLRPRILKHKITVSISLLCLLLYYFFFSLRIYNICSAIFICSVLLCIRMFSEIYATFSRASSFKDEIKDYLIDISKYKVSFYNQNSFYKVLHLIQEDIGEAISSDNFPVAKDDVLMFTNLISTFFSTLSELSKDRFFEVAKSCYWNLYLVVVDLRNQKADNYFCLYMSAVKNILNFYTHYKISIELWTDISSNFFSRVSAVNQSFLFYSNDFSELRTAIYENITIHESTWYGIVDFLSSLYNVLKSNDVYIMLPTLTKQRFWRTLVIDDMISKTEYSTMTDSRSLQKPRKLETNMFFKLLINNADFEVFYSVFPVKYCEYVDLNLSTMIYLYDVMHPKHSFIEFLTTHINALTGKNEPLHSLSVCMDKEILIDRINKAAFFLKDYWNITFRADSMSVFNTEERGEFLLYYILHQTELLTSDDIIEVIKTCFKDNLRIIEHLSCFKVYAKFEQRYKAFLQFLLGQSNIDYAEHTNAAFQILKRF